MVFYLFISFVILLRIAELILSKSNEKWLLRYGAVEYGKGHYPFIVLLHVMFFVSLIYENNLHQTESYSFFFLTSYMVLVALKIWVITSLGKFWNTKIYHIAGIPSIKRGIYKYIKHPNYLIVVAEIAIIPLAFHLYYTAVIFSILNAIILYVRIKEENKALEI